MNRHILDLVTCNQRKKW